MLEFCDTSVHLGVWIIVSLANRQGTNEQTTFYQCKKIIIITKNNKQMIQWTVFNVTLLIESNSPDELLWNQNNQKESCQPWTHGTIEEGWIGLFVQGEMYSVFSVPYKQTHSWFCSTSWISWITLHQLTGSWHKMPLSTTFSTLL